MFVGMKLNFFEICSWNRNIKYLSTISFLFPLIPFSLLQRTLHLKIFYSYNVLFSCQPGFLSLSALLSSFAFLNSSESLHMKTWCPQNCHLNRDLWFLWSARVYKWSTWTNVYIHFMSWFGTGQDGFFAVVREGAWPVHNVLWSHLASLARGRNRWFSFLVLFKREKHGDWNGLVLVYLQFVFLIPSVINIVAAPVHFLISLLFVVNCSSLTQLVISTFVPPIPTSIPGVESGRGRRGGMSWFGRVSLGSWTGEAVPKPPQEEMSLSAALVNGAKLSVVFISSQNCLCCLFSLSPWDALQLSLGTLINHSRLVLLTSHQKLFYWTQLNASLINI